VDAILAGSGPGVRAAVVGGGVLGLETAWGLAARGAAVQVFESLPRLMPRQLDEEAGALLLEMVRARGIESFLGVSIQELRGEERAAGLTLADGRRFDADLVVISTGLRPNVDWVKRSGVQCRRGVLVDDHMATSSPDVYAAGDVAEWGGQVVGLWSHAIEQAKVAAASALGRPGRFQGLLPVTTLKCQGIQVASLGHVAEDGDGGVTSRVTRGPGSYKRVVFREGIPVGALLLGSVSGLGELRRLVEDGLELERLRRQVVPDEVVTA
jgi:nitrite reductase (NADH) large subunit